MPSKLAMSAAGGRLRDRRRISRCPAQTTPSTFHRVLKDHPSVDISAGVHSHLLSQASARRLPAPHMFRPRRSSRPRRFPPPSDLRACCIPQPTMGFTGFPRPGPHACDRLRASSPVPTLQSFSLPRSVPRVTASSCPPAVRRRRRPGYEALFRSGIRDATDRVPVRDARCSPGLPHLEPRTCAGPAYVRGRPRDPTTTQR